MITVMASAAGNINAEEGRWEGEGGSEKAGLCSTKKCDGGLDTKKIIIPLHFINRILMKQNNTYKQKRNKNMKRTMALCWLAALTLTGIAAPVTPQQACRQAQMFLQDHAPQGPSRVLALPADDDAALRPYYVFPAKDDRGFVIISGDDAVGPVLGYADEGSFDAATLPDNVRYWLDYYAAAITFLQQHPEVAPQRVERHAEISPMTTTQWNQGAPYCYGCPTYEGHLCYTGCVAVAMAQMMNFHRWPQGATTAIPAYVTNTAIGTLDELPPTTFDWEALSDGTNEGFSDAVATLMAYCGHAVRTNYGPGGSSALSSLIATALKTYFGYDDDIRLASRSQYTIDTWDKLIYSEIAAGRPVIYNGRTTSVGHSFIVDGYRDGLYHINWGWSGKYDGYFDLSVVNPKRAEGFTLQQDAVVGIHPMDDIANAEQPRPYTSTFYAEGGYIYAKYANLGGPTVTFSIGMRIIDSQGQVTDKDLAVSSSLNAGFSSTQKIIASSLMDSLPAGTYTLVPTYQLPGAKEWEQSSPAGLYLTVTKAADGTLTFVQHPQVALSLKDLTVSGDLQVDHPQDLVFGIRNDGDEYYGVAYVFMSTSSTMGTPVSYCGTAIPGASDYNLHVYYTPTAAGTYHVWLATDREGKNIIGTRDLTFTNSQAGDAYLTLAADPILTMVGDDACTLQMSVTNNGNSNYLQGFPYEFRDKATGEVVDTGTINRQVYMLRTIRWTLTFSALDPTKTYTFDVYFYRNVSSADCLRLSSVDIVMPQATAIARPVVPCPMPTARYNLTGQRVTEDYRGIVIRNGRKYVNR